MSNLNDDIIIASGIPYKSLLLRVFVLQKKKLECLKLKVVKREAIAAKHLRKYKENKEFNYEYNDTINKN